ncbi:hypothetical protein Q5Y75_20360 [Ruegeria sp. 2205SS24-7]|uniref:hypothetical protein n=1 Tax=Ruegeria discodermiae TaxID=3064389 RepID=UPI002741270A|nr:hypothetical protein [Ruegeria sp. 2205SS24-7]MDP5219581.1 hypothetical protein [Ruegeria sp. 2205SS24-7]
MTMDRREVIKLGTAATLGAMLPSVALATPQNAAFEASYDDVLRRLREALGAQGLQEVAPLSILSGNPAYNGGLRHDFDQSALPQGGFVIQPLARVEDIAERHRADVLPIFHEVGCHPPNSLGKADQTRLMIRLLTEGFGLDPSRLAFVSVPDSEDMRPVLDEMGLPYGEKVILRDAEEAFDARDGSGYFFPDPSGEDFFVTMGVYYRVGDIDEPAPTSYPASANWTEIGEIVIAGETAPLGISLGAERLALAVSGQFPTWHERLGQLFAQVEQDATGDSEPAGLAAFR